MKTDEKRTTVRFYYASKFFFYNKNLINQLIYEKNYMIKISLYVQETSYDGLINRYLTC